MISRKKKGRGGERWGWGEMGEKERDKFLPSEPVATN